MTRTKVLLLLMLVAVPAGATGCVGGNDTTTPTATDATDAVTWPACVHPWPCGDGSEWPVDLAPPEDGFALAEVIPIRVPMDDGVELDGAVFLPDVPDDTPVPVILWATPYTGQCTFSGVVGAAVAPLGGNVRGPGCRDSPRDSESDGDTGTALYGYLGSAGYAFAMVNVRGTGFSGGCHDFYGARSQQDMAQLVTWLGEQPWSNGRVGMWGVSAMGTTPWMAAIEAPEALKTIAAAGIISDLYLNRFTPQGAAVTDTFLFHAGWASFNSEVPPIGAFMGSSVSDWPERTQLLADSAPQRLCPDVADRLSAGTRAQLLDDRPASFWEERRLVSRFDAITAAVLVTHGFQERGHAFQDDAIWPTMPNAPKRFLLGQWGHELVFDEGLAHYPGHNDTRDLLLAWFDFWLKGIGEPPRLGLVDHQVRNTDAEDIADHPWRTATAWPPEEAIEELLHFAGGDLSVGPGDGAAVFRAEAVVDADPCAEYVEAELANSQVRFLSEPVDQPVVIAGNPMAYLTLTVDQPGGVFGVDLYDIDPRGGCVATRISSGGVDLRFHAGNEAGEDFPVGTPTPVRVDLWSAAHRLEVGHQFAVVVSGAGERGFVGPPQYAPEVAIGGDSHVILPLVEGTLGGAAPTMDYPPRPFVPRKPSDPGASTSPDTR